MTLEEYFAAHPEAAIAFSGGVDSAFLLYAASRHARRVKAYMIDSAFQPRFELADAKRMADVLGAALEIIPLDILTVPEVAQNGPDRCYHCKRAIMGAICAAAQRDGFALVLDGTNATDAADERPGMRALTELGIASPLRDCGLTKAEIRHLSKQAGLFTWDKPAYACLATRICQGEAITKEKLMVTEKAEAVLAALGCRDMRVRMQAGHARIEVREDDMERLLAHRAEILSALKPLYKTVSLNLEVRG